MSKLYNRPRTPPSPPPLSHKSSSRSSRLDSKGESSKSYSNRDYDKFSSYSKYDRPKYEKSDKYDRYDKLDKSSSSSYLTSKEYRQDYSSSLNKGSNSHSDKYLSKGSGGGSSYQDDSYRSKGSIYSHSQNYSDRGDTYMSKYSPRNDKYKFSPSDNKDLGNSKYSSHSLSMGSAGDKKYAPYSSTANSSGKTGGGGSYSSKYGSENKSYYPKGDTYDSYDSYGRGGRARSPGGRGKGGGESARNYNEGSRGEGDSKGYSNTDSQDTYGGGYQRYVIGDSVVYGSPGHYPKDIYPPSPKAKRPRSPHSPPSLLSASHRGRGEPSKGFSRYSASPKRYSAKSRLSPARDDSYSRSQRKPPSPIDPAPYRGDRASRNYSPPLDRGKGYSDRFNFNKGAGGRYYDQRDGGLRDHPSSSDPYNRRKGDPPSYMKSPYSYNDQPPLRTDLGRDRYPNRIPKPLGSPKPLLSIPISVNSLPKESRANLRETLGLPRSRPLNGVDKRGGLKHRRLEGRIGTRKRPLSPKDKRRRRPDDLRLWIESRKTEGKANGASSSTGSKLKRNPKRPPLRGTTEGTRARLDSRRRILAKAKRKGGSTILRRGMRKPRRLLPSKTKPRDDSRRRGTSRDPPSKRDSAPGGGSREEGRTTGKKRPRDRKDVTTKSGENAPGSSANTRRLMKRPRMISDANSQPLKPRQIKTPRGSRRSPARGKGTLTTTTSSKSEKSHHASSKSKSGKDRPTRSRSRSRNRSKSRSRSRPRSHHLSHSRSHSLPRPRLLTRSRSRSRSRTPRRNDKD